MQKALKRILSILVCFVLITGTLCGCDKKIYITTGLEDNQIFKLSGKPLNLSEMLLVLMTEKNRYEVDLGGGIWSNYGATDGSSLEDEIKSKVKAQVAELKTIELLAEKEKIVLSDTEKEMLKEASKEFYGTLLPEEIESLSVTEADVLNLYTSFFMADKVYEKLTEDVDVEISDEEARVIQFKYIMLTTFTTNENGEIVSMTEAEKAAQYEKVSEALNLLQGGSDFDTVANSYSESNVTDGNMSRTTAKEGIEKVAFSLKSGEISGILETEDGYYIILCVNDYLESETEKNKEALREAYKKEAYDNIYLPFEAEQTFEFNNKIWDGIKFENYSVVKTTLLYDIYNKWVTPTEE